MENKLIELTKTSKSQNKSKKMKPFTMPSPSELAATRKKDNAMLEEYENQLNAILNSNPVESTDVIEDTDLMECKSFLTNLENELPETTILTEYPGISLDELSLDSVAERLESFRQMFIYDTLKIIINCNNDYDKLLYAIHHVFSQLAERSSDTETTLTEPDIICSLLLICAIKLNRKSKAIHTNANTYLRIILQAVPQQLQTEEFVTEICDSIASCFVNMHDQYELAISLIYKRVSPRELEHCPLYFPLRVARRLLFVTICQILGGDLSKCGRHLSHLASMMNKSERLQSLEPYEHYILLNILRALRPLLKHNKDSKKDDSANSWLLKYLSYMPKCTKQVCRVDFENIRQLQSHVNVLWSQSES